MATIRVMWPKKFGQRIVMIDEADFDPSLHGLAGGTVSIPVDAVSPAIEEQSPTTKEVEADIHVLPAPTPRPRKVSIPALEKPAAKGKKK